MTRRLIVSRTAIFLVASAFFTSLYRFGLLDATTLGDASVRLGEFVSSMFPPNHDVLSTLLRAMLETIEMAFVGTLLGFMLALPLSALGTRTLFSLAVTAAVRLLIGAIRTIPSLLWAIIFVVGFGLGPAAGAIGIAMYTVGYLGKLLSEAFEAVDTEVFEAVKSVSNNRIHLIVYAVLPEAANAVISQLLFMFEYNIRASSIMGFVGAGGIGFYMLGYLQLLQYRNLMTALLVTLAVVMAMDYLSAGLRSLILPSQQARVRAPLLAGVTTLLR